MIDVWMATIPASVLASARTEARTGNGNSSYPLAPPLPTPTGSQTVHVASTDEGFANPSEAIESEFRYYWATTPIDSVPFAVLQRMYVVSVSNWGVQNVVQVDLFGRHPVRGHLLLESVTSTAE